MKQLHYIYLACLLVSISVLLYMSLLYHFPVVQSSWWQQGQQVLGVVAIDILLVYGFNRWFWQWKIWYPWLVPFPNLRGTWQGKICSEWVDPKTKQKLAPILAQLTIKQTFLDTHCTMKTKEMKSESVYAGFDWSKGGPQLIYVYIGQPKSNVTERSPAHEGTMVFDFTHEGSKKLIGEYWTKRKTTGQATFHFKDKRLRYDVDHLVTHPAEAAVHNTTVGQAIHGNISNSSQDQGTNVSGNVQGDVNINHHHHKGKGDD